MVLEIVAAVGGSIAFAKYLGPILYHECFAPTSDDDLLLNAGLFPSERSPLLTQQYPSPSPRAESLRLATELYNGHLEDWVARQRASNSGGSTPAAITDASGATTPLSASPSTPASAASSYFDLRQPPLYINDVQVALERETKRRNSNDFNRANVLAGFHMASTNVSGTATPTTTDGLTMKRPNLARRFSNQTTLSAFDDEGLDEGLRRHAGFLRNMQNIQEDSIVRDVFEGLVCVKTACGGEGCEETTARFEGFSVLPLPAPPKREGNKKPSLAALLKAYEKPTVQEKPQWCRACAQYTQHTETKKVWSLPSTIIFQLPSTTPPTSTPSSSAGPSSASSSRTNSPHMMARRLSRSHSVSLPGSPFGGLSGMTPLSTQIPVDYPIESLDLGKFHGEARSSPSLSSSSTSSLPYDLSSESGDDELDGSRPAVESDGEEEDTYDLFAVRESVKENRYRVFAKDPVVEGQGKWAMFDAATGVSREVKDLREVVTPNADLLFYRRREQA
ncbi:hypothetical protein FRC00_014580 [Tulasnella sp. 408]|nr:hypothetical protein FRC00_014580 [Tulasnella sp. 408]